MFKIFFLDLYCSTDGPFLDCFRFVFGLESEFGWGVFCTIFWLIITVIITFLIFRIGLWLDPILEMRKEYIEKQEKKNKKGVKNGN